MKKLLTITALMVFTISLAAFAGNSLTTQVSQILEHKATLNLTDSQVKRLEIVEKVAMQKISDATMQANIRLKEIEDFTKNWSNMNGTSVKNLVKEYYDFQTDIKNAELNAILQARGILESSQMKKFHEIAAIDAMMLDMQKDFAIR